MYMDTETFSTHPLTDAERVAASKLIALGFTPDEVVNQILSVRLGKSDSPVVSTVAGVVFPPLPPCFCCGCREHDVEGNDCVQCGKEWADCLSDAELMGLI